MKWWRVSLTMDSLGAEKLLWFFVFSAEDLQHDSLSGSVSEKSRQDKGSADQGQHQPSKSRYEKGDNDQDGSEHNSKNRLSPFYILHFRYGDPVHLPSNLC
jgi:hypothetical protein